MVQNALFRQCLANVPAEQKAAFNLSYGIAERLEDILKSKGMTQKVSDIQTSNKTECCGRIEEGNSKGDSRSCCWNYHLSCFWNCHRVYYHGNYTNESSILCQRYVNGN